ncbi:DNA-directed RNA polymerase subunit omega [Hydrogenoanaerobacterium sp.]|uniref:DNA-directed RNA polymerase subunit omega n=1 Tax=Hydrogenoanaerobacterium sp. TaxID=2953763 RepID=UPI00289E8B7D|nr:DNA-directed RNA polymerase subunit omega [Hydrogenoanaerobacterium sp.]
MNMLRPSISQILKNNESPYSLVVAVAKRAREITEEAEENKKVLVEKPVMLAVEEFANGKVKLIESANIGLNIEE